VARFGWSALLALLCAGVTCLPLFFGTGLYVGNGTDLPWQHIPLRQWMGETARAGELPLWNPHLFNGYPPWVFRPPWSVNQALWFLSSDPRWILPLHILMQMTWLHLGVQTWMLSRGRSQAAALLAAQTLMLSGFVLGHLYAGHIDILEALSWSPWVLWTFARYHEQRTVAALLGAVLSIFFMLNTGHFHVSYLVLWTAVLWNAARLFAGEWRAGPTLGRYVLQTAQIALASAGLACVYLAPMLQTLGWFNRTSAAGGFDLNLQPLSSWLTWLVPDLMNLHTIPLNWSFYPLWECHAYMGLFVPVLLLGAAVPLRQRRGSLLFVALACLLALGPRTPVYTLYAYADPLLSLFRVPSRFLLPALLALSALIADAWDAPTTEKRSLWLSGLCWLGALSLASWGWWTTMVDVLSAGRALPVFEAQRFPDSLATMRMITALRLVAQGVLFGAATWLCWRRGALRARTALLGLLFLTSVDGSRIAYPYWAQRSAQPPALPAQWVATLQQHPEFRSVVDPGVLGGNWAPPYGVNQLDGGEISALGAYTVAVQAAAGMDEKGGVLFNLFGVNRLTQQLALRYYFSQRPPAQLTPDLRTLQPVQNLGAWWMYVNPAALPRVQAVHRLVPETAPRAYDNLRYLLALPEYPQGVASWRGEPWNGAPVRWELRKARYAGNRVQLEVWLDGPAVLLLADAYVPGWTVKVNGQPQRLLSLNAGLCRGVRLERGSHWVEFTYGIPGGAWAAFVSLATLTSLVLGSLRTLRAAPV
jgi:hypothetical protein